jgi:hypothetical protein
VLVDGFEGAAMRARVTRDVAGLDPFVGVAVGWLRAQRSPSP